MRRVCRIKNVYVKTFASFFCVGEMRLKILAVMNYFSFEQKYLNVQFTAHIKIMHETILFQGVVFLCEIALCRNDTIEFKCDPI